MTNPEQALEQVFSKALEQYVQYEAKDGTGTSIYFAELPVQHVLYESHVDGRLWLRNARDFFGPITEDSTLRFTSVGE